MELSKSILFSLLFLFSCNNHIQERSSSELSGKVISILDGDTYDILLEGNETIRIRMEGIDAPEKGMPYYNVSKKYLGQMCFEKIVRLEVTGKDNHGRTLAFSYLGDGTELSHEMIKAGLAWHFKKYSTDSVLSNLEILARDSKLGIWADKNPMPPWENRRLHREGISTKDSFNIDESQK
ncbi:MAG: thermonuclease family protein [Bacteroidota bacterium]